VSVSEAIQILFVRAADEFAPCADYVMRTFARWIGWPLQIADFSERTQALRAGDPPVVEVLYATEEDISQAKAPTPAQPRPKLTVWVERSRFFGPNFLVLPDLPEAPAALLEAANRDGFRKYVERGEAGTLKLSLDLVAAAFWFLSRYEEYVVSTPDAHGRFLCAHSILGPEFYEEPLVNRWFERIEEMILGGIGRAPAGPETEQVPTFVLTHDVDVLRKYRGLSGLRRTVGAMMRGNAREATSEIRMASLVLAGLRRDPYDSFDDLFALKERLGAPSTFYLMGGGSAPLDCDYRLEDQPIRELFMRISANGDELGLHPSYETFRSPELIAQEARALAEASGQELVGARQHYLRIALPETWYALAQAGLRYDASLGFADRAGFRCGWSGCFRPFDLEKRQEVPMVELPLVVMDMTLAVYENIPSQLALERLAKLLAASATRGGAFVLLWHNTLNDKRMFPGYWDTFEYFVFASAGSVRFETAARLCEAYELRLVNVG